MSTTKLAIAIDYDGWRLLLREFIDEVAGPDADLKVTMEWMETWPQRLRRKRQETTDAANRSKIPVGLRRN